MSVPGRALQLLARSDTHTHTMFQQTIHPKKKKKTHRGFVRTVLAHVFITRRFEIYASRGFPL